jgi:hypothetical protein
LHRERHRAKAEYRGQQGDFLARAALDSIRPHLKTQEQCLQLRQQPNAAGTRTLAPYPIGKHHERCALDEQKGEGRT